MGYGRCYSDAVRRIYRPLLRVDKKTARCPAALPRRCTRLWRDVAIPVRRGLRSGATSISRGGKSSLGDGSTYSLGRCSGRFFALLAWGALSDPKSLLGSRFREKSADAAQYFLLTRA